MADASPLIVLAKLGRLKLLDDLYGEVLIGPVVKAETIDAGKTIRALGVAYLENALENGWLRMVRLHTEENSLMASLVRNSRLDRGEAESIALARTRNLRLIVDDKEARSVATAAGVNLVGTAGMLLEAFLHRHIDMDELEAVLQDLIQVLWISPAIVAEILRTARGART
ncbi:MAG: hypothetical protein F4Y08_03030 [Caldilineaceae bacterium SB0662_bin_9]|uniref:DUF3368 domain-containing protein n=1 Tax=Caldilineaceae bacterium SB0662_bin_9 TaxID=2605258 RepID=A0A6B1DRG1_9CHLR|nr:hypothetical protein [Caldilineaceae bacterium SB0662_bin_9]